MKPIPKRPGRPKTNALGRAEQLRLAKRAQRERDRRDGHVFCQVKLRRPTAAMLRAGLGIPGFEAELGEYLNDAIVEVKRFPNLKLLCWNRGDRYLTDRDAFGLYERNWRFVDRGRLEKQERNLIDKLAAKYGNGVLNV